MLRLSLRTLPAALEEPIAPDNPFLVAYVTYHHYRSQGWVARSGIKFSVDWVLYKGSDGSLPPSIGSRGVGPPGGHAEFSVMVIKEYADPFDAARAARNRTIASREALYAEEIEAIEHSGDDPAGLGEETGQPSWKWFNTYNRVTSGVKKVRRVLLIVTIADRICRP